MTDQHLPDDLSIEDVGAAREWLRQMKQGGLHLEDHLTPAAIRVMEALLPSLTLADMTLDERDACAGMQADLAQGDRVVILDGTPDSDGLVQVLEKSLDVYSPHPDDVTPRPDLPRMAWPGDKGVAPAPALPGGWKLADHEKRGRVIVTNSTPNNAGHVCYVLPAADPLGYDWLFCTPDELTYIDIDQEAGQ